MPNKYNSEALDGLIILILIVIIHVRNAFRDKSEVYKIAESIKVPEIIKCAARSLYNHVNVGDDTHS